MNPALAIPAAKLAIGAATSLVNGIATALDPAKAKAKKQADEFETMFLEQMTERLMAAGESEGPLGENGTGGGIYRSMLTQEYARNLQRSGGIGLSDTIIRSLLQVQEQAGVATASGATRVGG